MSQIEIAQTILHEIPEDILVELKLNQELLEKWNALTDIARNEWICWITIVKQQKTRDEHIVRMKEDVLKGKKRPCCWP